MSIPPVETTPAEPTSDPASRAPSTEPAFEPESWRRWALPIVLFLATLVTTHYVGAGMHDVDVLAELERGGPIAGLVALARGADFAVPLMAILLAHELGHYFVARAHRLPLSPPHFIPMPLTLLGTMGAVIGMPPIRRRAALLDVSAGGPIAGLVVALPVLVYGLMTSPVEPLPASGSFILEGHSLLYGALLHATHGTIPPGHDIMLSSTAFAGWAGLLLTMVNLLPVGQLDGGHIAHALFGRRADALGKWITRALPFLALVVGAAYGIPAMQRGAPAEVVESEWLAGTHWLVWFALLSFFSWWGGPEHPPADDSELGRGRRAIAWSLLATFVVLFMPWWVRVG